MVDGTERISVEWGLNRTKIGLKFSGYWSTIPRSRPRLNRTKIGLKLNASMNLNLNVNASLNRTKIGLK